MATSACGCASARFTTMKTLLLLVLLAQPGCGALYTRRVIVSRAAAAAAASAAMPGLQAATAAQRGAENAYQTQTFGTEVCVKRTAMGACAETAREGATGEAPTKPEATRVKVLQIEEEPQSELVKSLLKKTADNAEANAREVKEKTIKANQPGQFGPFANTAPIMREDGSFDVVSLGKFQRLKDRGKITQTATGLDTYVKGFDPDIPEPKQKLFGLF